VSDFYGISVALSSLFAQRRAIEVTGQNVANANTEGYSRQRISTTARGAPIVPAIHTAATVLPGGGINVEGVTRLRNFFFEARSAEEHGNEERLRSLQQAYSRMELTFAEPGDTSLSGQLADFWAGWHDVANRPNDIAARTQLLERARTLVTGINTAANDLQTQWKNAKSQLETTLAEANSLATRVAELNDAIIRSNRAGLSPNELADQRDVLVRELGKLVGVTLRGGEAGSVDVLIGGTPIVLGPNAEELELDVPAGSDVLDGAVSDIIWVKDGLSASVTSGKAGGLLEIMNVTLPAYRAKLDAVAQSLTDTVNAQHALGFDLAGVAGTDLFAFDNTVATGGLTVEITDPSLVAASSDATALFDAANALTLADFSILSGGPDELIRSLAIGLGVDTQVANRRVQIQADITRQIDSIGDSEAGVNLDEEMANLVAYQRGYEAAARFLTTIDQMLDVLVNRTGYVGR
jgi:flagellar hook-associated protein 1 FlgK